MDRSAQIDRILSQQNVNGGPFWSRGDGNIHAPNGMSTLLVLNVLGELGASVRSHPQVAAAVEFVLDYQTPDGGLRYSPRGGKLPCLVGQGLAGIAKGGAADDPRAIAAMTWLISKRHDGGGWRCATVRWGKSTATDHSNPGATLFVLDALRYYGLQAQVRGDAAAGVESLLHHWETRLPTGPCAFGIGARFLSIEYPFTRYNLFYFVDVLSHYPQALADARFQAAYRELASHARGGQLIVEHPHKAWRGYEFAQPGQPNPVTARIFEDIRARAT